MLLQKYPENVGNYMDDWWIVTASNEEGRELHTWIIHEFLDLMEEKSYFLKPKKCQFEKDTMEILGWLIGGKIQIGQSQRHFRVAQRAQKQRRSQTHPGSTGLPATLHLWVL
jgi:hypothetical protein